VGDSIVVSFTLVPLLLGIPTARPTIMMVRKTTTRIVTGTKVDKNDEPLEAGSMTLNDDVTRSNS